MAPLTSIANRLTPSVPLEITFGQGVIATGRKFTTIFGHKAASGGTGTPYQVYTVINVGDPTLAKNEVDAVAGSGSQLGKMVSKFVSAAAVLGNFPAIRVVLIPFGQLSYGPNDEALNAVKFLRSDMFVSCYPTSDSVNRNKLQAVVHLISGPDRDLSGQFGSFATYGSLEDLATQNAYSVNDKQALAAALPDSNTALVPILGTVATASPVISAVSQAALTPTGDTQSGDTTISNVSDVSGIYPGAAISGTGIPVGAVVEQVIGTDLVISAAATATNSTEVLSIVNLPTAGIYEGAHVSGTGIPAGAVVTSVAASSITISQNATGSHAGEAISVQNVVSQSAEEVAAAHAGGLMASAFPYFPLTGVLCGGLSAPKKSSDWIAIDPAGASESALNADLSPLVVTNGSAVSYLRTRTTWVLQSDNVTPVTAYFDWQDLVTLNDFREDCFLIAKNPPFNNNPGGTKNSLQIASLFKDEVLREALAYEDAQAFQAVKALADQFVVAPSTTSRGRFDFKIPVNVLPGLYVIAGNIQAVTSFDFTL